MSRTVTSTVAVLLRCGKPWSWAVTMSVYAAHLSRSSGLEVASTPDRLSKLKSPDGSPAAREMMVNGVLKLQPQATKKIRSSSSSQVFALQINQSKWYIKTFSHLQFYSSTPHWHLHLGQLLSGWTKTVLQGFQEPQCYNIDVQRQERCHSHRALWFSLLL